MLIVSGLSVQQVFLSFFLTFFENILKEEKRLPMISGAAPSPRHYIVSVRAIRGGQAK